MQINRYVLCMIYEKGKKCSTNATASTKTGITDTTEALADSIPHNQSTSIASSPHQANSQLQDMDTSLQSPEWHNNYNDDIWCPLHEPDYEEAQLDFLNQSN